MEWKTALNVSNEHCYVSGQFLLCCGGKRLRLFAALSCCLVFHHTFRNPRFRSQAMYGVYDGHGPAGHDCSDLSLRRLDDGTHPLDFRKKMTIQRFRWYNDIEVWSWCKVVGHKFLGWCATAWQSWNVAVHFLRLARKLCSAFLNDPDRERDPGAVLTKARPQEHDQGKNYSRMNQLSKGSHYEFPLWISGTVGDCNFQREVLVFYTIICMKIHLYVAEYLQSRANLLVE